MKLLRVFLIGVAVLAALAVLLLSLALSSGVQTWAARKAIAGQPGLNAAVSRVSVGLNRTELTGLRVETAGVKLDLPSASVELSALAAVRGNIVLKRLVAKGWTLDLTAPAATPSTTNTSAPTRPAASPSARAEKTPSAATPEQAAFDGIFKQLKLPAGLAIDHIDLEGEIIFPAGPGKPPGRSRVSITGGGLAAQREGRFTFTAQVALADASAPVSRVETACVFTAHMDTPRSFDRLGVQTEIKATGSKFPQGTRLRAGIDLGGGANRGEIYTVTVLAPGGGTPKKLLDLVISAPGGPAPVSGRWKLDASDTDLAPFTLGHALPVFLAAGEGTFELGRTFESLHAGGRVDATVEKLETLLPELAALGRIRGQIDFDLAKEGDLIRLERLGGSVANDKPIASVQALQRIEYDLARGELKIANGSAELLRLTLHGLPLAWAQPFLKDIVLEGDDLRGEFFASARDGGVALRPTAPLTLTRLSVSRAGQPLVRALDLSVKLNADYHARGWQADVSEFLLRSGGTTLLALTAKAGQPSAPGQPLKATGTYELNLPALLRQPAAAALPALSQGTAAGAFSASLDTTRQIQAGLALTGLVVRDQPLPSVRTDLRLDVQPDGTLEAQVPLTIEGKGRKSELQLNARVTTVPGSTQIDAQLSGETVYVEDLQRFQALTAPADTAAAQPAAKPAEPKPPSAPPAPDQAPFWTGCTGQLRIAIKEVVYSADFKASNITGALEIEPAAITLSGLTAGLGAGSDAALNGTIAFSPAVPEPYVFSGDATVTGFDPGPFFRAANPGKPPTVEGRFDVAGKLTGTAPNTAALARRIKADVSLSSREGLFRGLALPPAFAERFKGKSGNLLNNLTGVVGSLTGGSKAADITLIATELVLLFAETRYDQLSLKLSHDAAAGLVRLSDFSLISPKLRLAGGGSVLWQEGVHFLKQPLTAQLDMGVHGSVAELLGRNGMLRGGADSLGYAPLFATAQLDGTLSEIGTQALMHVLLQKILSLSANPLGNLFGK